MKLLNLGCGQRYHSDWVNIDFTSSDKDVIAHNLLTGVPAPSNSYNLVYHSHLLEHFSFYEAPKFLQECFRVLHPHGVLRIVVPDLESVVNGYLDALKKAENNLSGWKDNYRWMQIELLDQLVRNQPGGLMSSYLSQEHIPNLDFIIQRLGSEAKKFTDRERSQSGNQGKTYASNFPTTSRTLESFAQPIYRFFRYSSYRRNAFLKLILSSKEYQSLRIGSFRQMGEVHQWMYDRYSLTQLIQQCGFIDIIQRNATTSYLEGWSAYNLDTEPDGSVYKPDSLFVEAIKPEL
ncbi:methyltransferase domain-containing protein [Leptolyngbya sp. CCNP1308]|uniref:class I SAM-dependent methyltransferase n=1 Tax=Leptolyngbya sp. CCNP1308 TaxID=3110255 RepID=UPI002B1FD851|nr:methyltransferase domain-containing protein [Leptolyngbya sp. CCNP1308]MEA5452268.1 methyltransferase domain-containing protein [Leptolyngbya sp. CCNP1308]